MPPPPQTSSPCAYLFWQHEDDPPHTLVGSLVTLDGGMTTIRAGDETELVAAVNRALALDGCPPGGYVLVRRPQPHAAVASCPPCRLDTLTERRAG